MKTNEYLKDQKQIFWDLLAATVLELDIYPDIVKGEFTFGANESVFSFRNCGKGFLSGVIAKAVLPTTEKGVADGQMSDLYPMEALLKADVRDEPEYPKVTFPIPHSTRVSRMIDILPGFTDEELERDEKLAYILGK